jgi:DNA-binding transcriptional MerR regulator
MRIGELSCRTGTTARMLRYYEEQGLLRPERDASGYRCYPPSAVARVAEIRGLLESGMSSQIIAAILPCLDNPPDVKATAHCLPPDTIELITAELGRLQQRIDCLARSRDAIRAYLATRFASERDAAPAGPGENNPSFPIGELDNHERS